MLYRYLKLEVPHRKATSPPVNPIQTKTMNLIKALTPIKALNPNRKSNKNLA